ncbi:MAG: TonB-dependent receptor [Bacteroidota bacterium]
MSRLVSYLCLIILLPASAISQGKLAGRVLDQKGEPIIGANVILMGTTIGAAANEDGYYVVLNGPVGVFDVRFSSIGYATETVKGVRINAGLSTTLNATLKEQIIQSEEIVVMASQPLVDTRQTSAVAIMGKEEMKIMPVQNLDDIVNLQAGVVDGHFRGGRTGEVQYQVDGVSVNNPYDNSASVQLDKSVLEEVQVISGTFDAEYGQAMSGVVNAVLRSGSDERYDIYAEVYSGGFLLNPSDNPDFPHMNKVRPTSLRNYTLTVSGPTGLDQTSFLVSLRRFTSDGYLYGERRFVPTDSSNFQQKIFRPNGDGSIIPMDQNSEWSWQFKLSNKTITNLQTNYQAIGSIGTSQRYDFGFRFNPGGRTTQNRTTLVHGFEFIYSLSSTTVLNLNVRHNYFDYTDWAFSSIFDPAYQRAGPPRGDANYELGAIIQGVSLGRFKQKTNALLLKGAIISQIGEHHLLKAGAEGQYSVVGFGAPGTIYEAVLNGAEVLVPVIDDSLHPGLRNYYPVSMAAYVQDRIEFPFLLIRAGFRIEYFDANGRLPGNLQNPANVIQGAPTATRVKTNPKIVIAPRLGISYPVGNRGAVYFSYGHFYQMPGLSLLYSNSDYSILKNLQAGSVSYGVMGNPDLEPEFTVQYEFGVKSEFGENVGVDLSMFYKDVRDLLGVEFISTYTAADYARFTNVDFGSVYGATLSYTQEFSGTLSWSVNYTYQRALGNSSDPYETANRAAAGADPRPRQVPFGWDQFHTINSALMVNSENDYSASLVFRYGNGSPYTPAIGSGFGADLEENSARKPSWAVVDARVEKYFLIDNFDVSVFLRAFNVFDTRYGNGFVFPTTGSPDYSLTPAGDAAQLINPTRFSAPRRVEAGVSVRF